MVPSIFSGKAIARRIDEIQGFLQQFPAPVFAILSVVYYSFNTLFFPHGISGILLFGIVMVPYLILTSNIFRWIVLFLVALFFLKAGSDIQTGFFARSSLLFLSFSGLFLLFTSFLRSQPSIEKWIIGLSAFNVVLIFGFLALWFTPWKELVWWRFFLSSSVGDFTRLRGFTYEPSYYSLTLVPLLLYHISHLLTKRFSWTHFLLLAGLFVGLAFSFSLGVWLGLAICLTASIFYFLSDPTFFKKNRILISVLLSTGIVMLILIVVLFPGNPLFVRMQDLVNGKDLSGNSRLYDSFVLCFRILGIDNLFLGLGPGQLKWQAYETIKDFYHYEYKDSWSPAMPNSATDWLCTFGILGFGAKLFFECWFFLKTFVFKDFYRFSCFVFIFIYQFTGGFLFCLPELVLWSLAFYVPEILHSNSPKKV